MLIFYFDGDLINNKMLVIRNLQVLDVELHWFLIIERFGQLVFRHSPTYFQRLSD